MSHQNVPIGKEALSPASRSSGRTLENKCAVVFGAGGSIGAAVAREFAAEGASLPGRPKKSQPGSGCRANRSGRRQSGDNGGRRPG